MAEAARACNRANGTGALTLGAIFAPQISWKWQLSDRAAAIPAGTQGEIGMRSLAKSALLLAACAGLASTGSVPAAAATAHDGNWSVLIITQKGDCDQAYRYGIKVANGHVSYAGDAKVDMSGTVDANGAVAVRIRLGDKGANGSGRLSGQAGAGTWQGAGSGVSCSGRWEAERRS
jgi:hypothetical protein